MDNIFICTMLCGHLLHPFSHKHIYLKKTQAPPPLYSNGGPLTGCIILPPPPPWVCFPAQPPGGASGSVSPPSHQVAPPALFPHPATRWRLRLCFPTQPPGGASGSVSPSSHQVAPHDGGVPCPVAESAMSSELMSVIQQRFTISFTCSAPSTYTWCPAPLIVYKYNKDILK